MTAREEMEAVHIFRTLTEQGYLIQQNGDRWKVTEPLQREKPQQYVAAQSMREVMAWANGCEQIRFINGIGKEAPA